MKKSNLSINMIIAIVLILIIILLLAWKLKDSFSAVDQTYSCEQRGGRCTDVRCDGTITDFKCPSNKICCLNLDG